MAVIENEDVGLKEHEMACYINVALNNGRFKDYHYSLGFWVALNKDKSLLRLFCCL